MHLNQVTLATNDVAASREFYLALGFVLIVDTPHYLRYRCIDGGSSFSVSLVEEAMEKQHTVVYFESDNLEAWVELIISRGITVAQMPKEERYLWTEAVVYDPAGNKLKLYSAGENRLHPPWEVEITYESVNGLE